MLYLVEEYLVKRVNGKVVSEETLYYETALGELLKNINNVNLTEDDVFHSKKEAEEFIINYLVCYCTKRNDGKELHYRPVEIAVL